MQPRKRARKGGTTNTRLDIARLTDGNCAIMLSCQEEHAREGAKQLIAPDEVRIASLRRKNAAILWRVYD
jgi:hypothetical protein